MSESKIKKNANLLGLHCDKKIINGNVKYALILEVTELAKNIPIPAYKSLTEWEEIFRGSVVDHLWIS